MANTKDINSTERLLNVIRGISKPSSTAEDTAENASNIQKITKKQTINLSKAFTVKKRLTIGVDISQDYINLAKTAKSSDGKPLLLDQKIIKYGGQPSISAAEFTELLKTSVTSFAGSLEDCEIWATMQSADVNVQHIKIPRVPKKQLDNVIYWTAKKENPIDEKESVFDFEMQGEIIDQGIPKYSVMVYSAPRSEVERLKNLFLAAGLNLSGITIAPFAIQNIFRTKWVDAGEKTFASLFIGNDFSRIDVYNNRNLVMTRGIKTGISSLMEVIDESIAETNPEDRSRKEEIKSLLTSLMYNPERVAADNSISSWINNGIFEMIDPVMERLIRQIERTLEYYTSSVGYEKVEKLYVSSIINLFYNPFLSYLSEQLGAKVEFFDPFEGKNVSASASTLTPAIKSMLVPAIGLAFSDRRYTPNIIFTYIEKNKEITQTRINRAIFVVFGMALIICMAVLGFQAIETKKLNNERLRLEQALSAYHPILSKEKISQLSEDLKLRHQVNGQYAQKYRSIALIGELSTLTPDSIKLIRIRMSASGQINPDGNKESQTRDNPVKDKEEIVTIEGVVTGERSRLDSTLAQYVITLEKSPMLQGVMIQKSSVVSYRKKEIIQFTINAKIG